MSESRRAINFKKSYAIFIGLTPICFYYYFVFTHSENIPYADDFMTILNFLISYSKASSISDTVKYLFQDINGHFLTFEYLVSLIQYEIAGSVNFKVLNIIGNFSILGIVILLFKIYQHSIHSHTRYYYFLPVVFLIFQFQYHEGIFWATVSLQHFFVLFFAFLAIYLAAKKPWKYVVTAFFFAGVAQFTSGSGILAFLAIGILLIFQKRYKVAGVWFVAILPLIYVFYQSVTIYSSGDQSIRHVVLQSPQNILIFVLNFLGASWNIDGSWEYLLPLLMGFIMFLLLIHLTINRYYERSAVIYTMMLFLLLTIAVTALARSEIPNGAFASRYKFIPAVMMALLYLAMLNSYRKRTVFRYAMVISLVFYYFAISENYKDVEYKPKSLQKGLAKWAINLEPGAKTLTAHPGSELPSSSIFKIAIEENIYIPPQLGKAHFPYFKKASRTESLVINGGIESWIESFSENGKFLNTSGWAYIRGANSENSKINLVLSAKNTSHIFPTFPVFRPDITTAKKSTVNLDNSGFACIIDISQLPNGDYEVGFLITNDSIEDKFKKVNKMVGIKRPTDLALNAVNSENIRYHLEDVMENSSSFQIKGNVGFTETFPEGVETSLVLQSHDQEYYFPITLDVSDSLKNAYFDLRIYKTPASGRDLSDWCI